MKIILIIIILFGCVFLTTAKSIGQIKANRQTYIWDVVSANSLKKADNIALNILISQISTE